VHLPFSLHRCAHRFHAIMHPPKPQPALLHGDFTRDRDQPRMSRRTFRITACSSGVRTKANKA
jgi:hypothetical protein